VADSIAGSVSFSSGVTCAARAAAEGGPWGALWRPASMQPVRFDAEEARDGSRVLPSQGGRLAMAVVERRDALGDGTWISWMRPPAEGVVIRGGVQVVRVWAGRHLTSPGWAGSPGSGGARRAGPPKLTLPTAGKGGKCQPHPPFQGSRHSRPPM